MWRRVGATVGDSLGCDVPMGDRVGSLKTPLVGPYVGTADGEGEGSFDLLRLQVGWKVGAMVGCTKGSLVGSDKTPLVGAIVGPYRTKILVVGERREMRSSLLLLSTAVRLKQIETTQANLQINQAKPINQSNTIETYDSWHVSRFICRSSVDVATGWRNRGRLTWL